MSSGSDICDNELSKKMPSTMLGIFIFPTLEQNI